MAAATADEPADQQCGGASTLRSPSACASGAGRADDSAVDGPDRLGEACIPTALGVLHEAGYPEPWIIAMDCPPKRAAVSDYGARWAIEPMFSDFKSRGFRLEDTKLEAPKRLDCLILILLSSLRTYPRKLNSPVTRTVDLS